MKAPGGTYHRKLSKELIHMSMKLKQGKIASWNILNRITINAGSVMDFLQCMVAVDGIHDIQ